MKIELTEETIRTLRKIIMNIENYRYEKKDNSDFKMEDSNGMLTWEGEKPEKIIEEALDYLHSRIWDKTINMEYLVDNLLGNPSFNEPMDLHSWKE